MANPLKLYLFGDQTYDVQPFLKTLLRHRDNVVLEDFLSRVYDAVRAEIYRLPAQVRDDLPRFTCLDDLLLWDQSGTRCIPLDMAITSIYQLGSFISNADPDYAVTDRSQILGLCTGAFAAAAVSCSHGTLELVPLAVDAVVAAFRTGLCVTEVAKRLSHSSDTNQSWSIVVPKLASAEAVKKFSEASTLPSITKPYISAFAPSGITVSGPPHSLRQLLASELFRSIRYKDIPIYGPYHCPHLYSYFDVDSIVKDLASAHATTSSQQVPLISSTGTRVKGHSFADLLQDAIAQCLLQPIRWSLILDVLKTSIQDIQPQAFSIMSFGSTADQLIYNSLKHTPVHSLLPSTANSVPSSRTSDSLHASPKKPKLAIIGMSGRFPGAKDNEAFWDLLHKGLDVHKPVPELHWDARTHVDPTGTQKNTSATPFGCWLDDPAVFDARFFNISPREAYQIDPAQRLALMTAYEAIEQAGIVPDATPSTRPDRVGVFYGVTSNDWMETNSAQNIDTYFIPGGNRAFIPGRINYCFKFSGPSYAVDTACSSSLSGIHLACNSLWRGDVDTAIAGGTNVLTNPDFTAGLDRGHFLSRTGNCKTFDDGADGYCRGEGIGTIIIKRLDDAIADSDPILGVILGTYTNHSAESESITRPHVGAQRAIFSKIINQAAIDPYSISYVEMHGTGTQAGDAGEMSSVLDTFAPPLSKVKSGRTTNEALYLGSAKANIGHGEAASGVSSVIKVLLMMQKDTIVPHCGIKTKINRKFPTDLQDRNVRIALEPTPWKRDADPSKPRRVFVNNFSAAGGNSALLIEDAPLKIDNLNIDPDPRTQHIIAISAKSSTSLQGNLKSLLETLESQPDLSLGQLSYTTTARRIHHQHRVMLVGSTISEICTQINSALRDNLGMTRPKSAPKIIFTFTGQGAQYPGMGNQLFQNISFFRDEVHHLDQICQSLGFPSILPVMAAEGQEIDAFAPAAVQLASVCMQIALVKLWASWEIVPTAVIGHSLGEYAALNAAGVLSDADTIYLVGKRAELLQSKCAEGTHAMLVVKGSTQEIAAVLGNRKYETACINSPVETVLAGAGNDVTVYKDLLTDAGFKSTLLKVPYAFHSSQVIPILADFEEIASGVSFSKPHLPVICPLNGDVVEDLDVFGPRYLVNHSRMPVNMFKALQTASDARIIDDRTVVLEQGPHPAVSGMIRAVLGTQVTSLASCQRGRSVWQILNTAFKTLYTAGSSIRWAEYQRDFKASHEVVPLPAYNWDLKEYWMQYVNDWSLRKGDPLPTVTRGPEIESTTIHRIVEESGDSAKVNIIVEADIARKDLSPLVQGHEVDGIPLCTPSVYADIALSLGTYLLQKYKPTQPEDLVDVSSMTISKALILKAGATQQPLQAHAEADWKTQSVAIKFMSFDNKHKLQEHARCVLKFTDKSFRKTLEKDLSSVRQKMQDLQEGVAAFTTARFNRPMVYRAIRPLARFHDDYRAIDEILLNSQTLEAVSQLSFGSVKRGGHFHTHPAIIDSLTQSCGFTMNCNDSTDLDKEVFMNHGWGSFQIYEPMDFDKKYTTYTQMHEGSDKLWYGDVVILDGEQIVAYFGQIAIQGVPRRVLKVILSLESGIKSQSQQPMIKNQHVSGSKTRASLIQAPSQAVTESSQSKFTQALSIIAEESGIAVSDLTEGTVFADAGIDSLLGLTISARFKEDLDIDIDFNALFFDVPTVGELKAFLGGSDSISSASSDPGLSETGSVISSSGRSGSSTPRTEHDFSVNTGVNFQRAIQIISEESGVAAEDLSDDTNFADSGVDSLLSLVIASRFRDELDLDFQHESLFLECPTIQDLKKLLTGSVDNAIEDLARKPEPPQAIPRQAEEVVKNHQAPPPTIPERGDLKVRKKAVDDYVNKYTAGFLAPGYPKEPLVSSKNEKVVLVTGASGSLGGHLVYHLAQLSDVTKIVCLNRENRAEPYVRQQKAMRDKGIRFPEALKPKLLVLQTDTSKPMFGLSQSDYRGLVGSVTHLIHNAWPMSAKRPLAGFESQFQVMRNLIDLSSDIVSQRPNSFKFSFQMISSVGVVGRFGLGNGKERTMVPEDRVGIDCVLPNGYGDAKWGCERMLDETLHKYPERFRTMVVRLGQIAGSKTSGYWNPMEHFGFLIKSSQTLNALPDVDGTVYWTPVNDIAGALSDLALAQHDPYPVYHIENPVGQPWREVNEILADALNITNLVPFDEWLELVRASPQQNNPASTLLEFLDDNYLRMSCGGLVLDVKKTLEHSKTLSTVGPVSEEVVRKYIHIWKEIGFLNA